MNVTVTGGCGFIGSHLIERLLGDFSIGKIYCIDSLEYGVSKNLPQSNKIELIQHKLGTDDISRLENILKDSQFLFHLAAEKHNQSINEPHSVFKSNIIGTSDLFDLAGKLNIQKIVFSSSLYAYGRMHLPPMLETEIPEPKTIYGISKLTGEHLLKFYANKYNFKYNILRYFFVIGPKQFGNLGYKSVVVKSFDRILQNQNPEIYGDGEQRLDYSYVGDVAEATLLAMFSDVSGEVFNVGSGFSITVNELMKKIVKIAQWNGAIEYKSPDWTHGTNRTANIEKIKKILNWYPKTSIDDALLKTFKFLKEKNYGI